MISAATAVLHSHRPMFPNLGTSRRQAPLYSHFDLSRHPLDELWSDPPPLFARLSSPPPPPQGPLGPRHGLEGEGGTNTMASCQTPPSRAPSLCPAIVALMPNARLNGTCNRQ